jgi:hypothetical protein
MPRVVKKQGGVIEGSVSVCVRRDSTVCHARNYSQCRRIGKGHGTSFYSGRIRRSMTHSMKIRYVCLTKNTAEVILFTATTSLFDYLIMINRETHGQYSTSHAFNYEEVLSSTSPGL